MTTVFRARTPTSNIFLRSTSRGSAGVTLFLPPSSSSNTGTTTHTAPRAATTAASARTFTSLNQATPFQLCFLRHGQSTWNRDNRFIGWTDTPLTDQGVLEAKVAGQMLAKSRIQFDEVHTSLLRRSIRTTNIALMELQQEYIPVRKSWRLNERNYGDLVGQNKKETVATFGADQVKRWRRSYDEPPPPMREDHPHHPARDPRYRNMLHKIPKSESLKCTLDRTSVYWDQVLAPALRAGKTLLVVGHENNLRSIIMRLEGISPADIINLSLPRAVPLAYRLDGDLRPLNARPDGSLDEATGFLRGEWLGGDRAVAEILERDHRQVYDIRTTQNLEKGAIRAVDWNAVLPEARAKAVANDVPCDVSSLTGTAAVTCSMLEPGHDLLFTSPRTASSSSSARELPPVPPRKRARAPAVVPPATDQRAQAVA